MKKIVQEWMKRLCINRIAAVYVLTSQNAGFTTLMPQAEFKERRTQPQNQEDNKQSDHPNLCKASYTS